MSMHKYPPLNTPEIHAAMRSYGIPHDRADMMADAFRLGWAAAQPGWKPDRCAECDCEIGGMECTWIRGRRRGASKGGDDE